MAESPRKAELKSGTGGAPAAAAAQALTEQGIGYVCVHYKHSHFCQHL